MFSTNMYCIFLEVLILAQISHAFCPVQFKPTVNPETLLVKIINAFTETYFQFCPKSPLFWCRFYSKILNPLIVNKTSLVACLLSDWGGERGLQSGLQLFI